MVGFIMLILLIPALCLRAWATQVLWGWYIVPLFGLPSLPFAGALGVMLIIGYLTSGATPSDVATDDTTKVASFLVNGFVMPFFAIGLGWLCLALFPLEIGQ